MSDRMSGAELAVRRHSLGVTGPELADLLGVTERTVRAWESEREPIPYAVPDELAQLVAEHGRLTESMVTSDRIIGIVRDKGVPTPRPRGWHIAAAARAMEREPDLMVEWV